MAVQGEPIVLRKKGGIHFTAELGRRRQRGALVDAFGVEKEAVHVEDHGRRLVRQLQRCTPSMRQPSCRSTTTCVQSPWISSVAGMRSGTMTAIMPAADADRTPLWESSS